MKRRRDRCKSCCTPCIIQSRILKYRESVFISYREILVNILYIISEEKERKILAVEVMPDHTRLFVPVPPTVASSEVVKKL